MGESEIKKFNQGSLDSLCSVYALVNTYKSVKNVNDELSNEIFNKIIKYLHKKRILCDTLIEGTSHKTMSKILREVVGDDFSEVINLYKWGEYSLSAWWDYTKEYSQNGYKIIVSIGGVRNHYSVIDRMTDKTMFMIDSNGLDRVRKKDCEIQGYLKDDKYVIYPSQCFIVR
jgi:hypothetical protein